jgi:hypothetical protein
MLFPPEVKQPEREADYSPFILLLLLKSVYRDAANIFASRVQRTGEVCRSVAQTRFSLLSKLPEPGTLSIVPACLRVQTGGAPAVAHIDPCSAASGRFRLSLIFRYSFPFSSISSFPHRVLVTFHKEEHNRIPSAREDAVFGNTAPSAEGPEFET